MEKDNLIEPNNNEEIVERESSIDLQKLDKVNEPEKELSEVEQLKQQLAAERAARARDKAARDKAMKERAELSRKVKEQEQAIEEPNSELEELRALLAEKDLKDKKTDLLLAATDRMAISQEVASNIVNSVYHPDTGEVDVDSLVDSFVTIINDARKQADLEGYNRRDAEVASNKPRSVGGNKENISVEDAVLEKYKQKYQRGN